MSNNAEDNPRTKSFLDEIAEVSRRHGLSIGHEDCHGGFIVSEFDEGDIEWLMGAIDETKAGAKS